MTIGSLLTQILIKDQLNESSLVRLSGSGRDQGLIKYSSLEIKS